MEPPLRRDNPVEGHMTRLLALLAVIALLVAASTIFAIEHHRQVAECATQGCK
jgi:hypothetical protein